MWITLLCQALSVVESHANRLALSLWAASEDAPPHWNNPLACTRNEAVSWLATAAGVRIYPDLRAGVDATARELSLSAYAGVVAALGASAGLEAVWAAVNVSPWRPGAQGGHYPLELFHAWQPDLEVGPLGGEVDLD